MAFMSTSSGYLRNACSGRVARRFPSWSILDDDDRPIRTWRIADAAGVTMLGRIVTPAGFERLALACGVWMAVALLPLEIVGRADPRGDRAAAPRSAWLTRVHVNDDVRLEIGISRRSAANGSNLLALHQNHRL